ncbi:MAG: helix-turn-helix domain-containing protein [Lachnospiraceae bacterium]
MNKDSIQRTLDYIEDNLKTDITATELADIAGYSVFHYYRLFQNAVGFPVMQYILRRRLLNAIYEIGMGRKKIDVALEYGFETYPGFYKSFIREIGYTPSEYLRKFKAKKPYKINIFQEEHIMMSQKRIADILVNWGLQNEKIADIVFPETGEISDTAKYVGDEYVIKYTSNLGNVNKAVEITKALESVGLSTSSIIPTIDDKEYVTNGELYFTLFKKVVGERVMAGDLYIDDYEKKARFIGEIIGQLDLALQKVDVVVDEVNTYDAVMNWALPELGASLSVKKAFLEEYKIKFRELYEALPRQIIHRDPNPSNIIIAQDKWGFIDFELSESNVRIFDPCYAATAILSETFEAGNDEKINRWINVMKEIMCGYDSVVKMTEEEKTAIPYIILSNQFISTAYFFGKDKYQELFETNKKMTEWIINHFGEIKPSN